MDKPEPVFADGLFIQKPKEGAPTFIKGRVSVNVDVFVAWLLKHKLESEYINLDLKQSAQGKLYFQLNDWKPDGSKAKTETKSEDENDGFGPF